MKPNSKNCNKKDPMEVILKLLSNNKKYIEKMNKEDPNHFTELSKI